MNLKDILLEIESNTKVEDTISKKAKIISVDKEIVSSLVESTFEALKKQRFSSFIGKLKLALGLGRSITYETKFKIANSEGKIFTVHFQVIPVRLHKLENTFFYDAGVARVTDDSFIFYITFNVNRWKAFERSPKRYKPTLYSLVVHELTHVSDPRLLDPMHKPSGQILEESGFVAYFNDDAEVTARFSETIYFLENNFEELKAEAMTLPGKLNINLLKILLQEMPSPLLEAYSLYSPQNKKLFRQLMLVEIDKLLKTKRASLVKRSFKSVPDDIPPEMVASHMDFFSEKLALIYVSNREFTNYAKDLELYTEIGVAKLKGLYYDTDQFEKVTQNLTLQLDKDLVLLKKVLAQYRSLLDTIDIEGHKDIHLKYAHQLKEGGLLTDLKRFVTAPLKSFDAKGFLREYLDTIKNFGLFILMVNQNLISKNLVLLQDLRQQERWFLTTQSLSFFEAVKTIITSLFKNLKDTEKLVIKIYQS